MGEVVRTLALIKSFAKQANPKAKEKQSQQQDALAAIQQTESEATSKLVPAGDIADKANEVQSSLDQAESQSDKAEAPEKPSKQEKARLEDADKRLTEAEQQSDLDVVKEEPAPPDADGAEEEEEESVSAKRVQASRDPSVTGEGVTAQRAPVQRGAVQRGIKGAWRRFKSWVAKRFASLAGRIKRLFAKIRARVVGLVLDATGLKAPVMEFMGALSTSKAGVPGAITAEGGVADSAESAGKLAEEISAKLPK
jgi:hypothetical protein